MFDQEGSKSQGSQLSPLIRSQALYLLALMLSHGGRVFTSVGGLVHDEHATVASRPLSPRVLSEIDFFIDNLLVRIHFHHRDDVIGPALRHGSVDSLLQEA
jgi:hypothetical protein